MNKAPLNAQSVRRIGFTWAISLPICFTLGWLAGYFLSPHPAAAIEGTNVGSLIGLSLGGTISGLGTALELRAKYPNLKLVHAIIICGGWTLTMLIIAGIRYAIARMD